MNNFLVMKFSIHTNFQEHIMFIIRGISIQKLYKFVSLKINLAIHFVRKNTFRNDHA